MAPDDIKVRNPATESTEHAPDRTPSRHSIGPESEDRGGSQAPERSLDQARGGGTADATAGQKSDMPRAAKRQSR